MGVLLLVGLFFMMPYFVGMLYAPHYRDASTVFRILIFGSICALYSGFYDPIIESMKRYRFIQILTLAGVAFNLSLDYILVSRIGFLGAAIATVVTYFLLAVAREIYFKKYCRASI
jgi:O-antigen/teichoic acid export membrane protein